MRLIIPTTHHLREFRTWFPDEPSLRVWGGPIFRYPFTEQTFLKDIHWGEMATYALVDDEATMVAFGQLYVRDDRTHLARLAVTPSRRGVGHGLTLVKALIDKGRELFPYTENSLYVMQTNEQALRCYRKAGFVEVPISVEERQYPDQLFMVRRLA